MPINTAVSTLDLSLTLGRNTANAASRRPFIAGAGVWVQACPLGICDSITGTGFSPNTYVIPSHSQCTTFPETRLYSSFGVIDTRTAAFAPALPSTASSARSTPIALYLSLIPHVPFGFLASVLVIYRK